MSMSRRSARDRSRWAVITVVLAMSLAPLASAAASDAPAPLPEQPSVSETGPADHGADPAADEAQQSDSEPVPPDETAESVVDEAQEPERAASALPTRSAPAVVMPLSALPSVQVNSLGLDSDANIGDGQCDTGALVGSDPECTLVAALEEANVAAVGPIDITFTVTGTMDVGIGDEMFSGTVGDNWGWLGLDAQFLIDSDTPVTIDFTGLDAISHTADWDNAMFYVVSDDVTLRNLTNLRGAESQVAVAGSNVLIDNVDMADPDTAAAETGVALLDGASNVTIQNLNIESQFFHGVVVDRNATVSNVTITNVTSRDHARTHIDFDSGSVVNGFTVSDSVFGAADEVFLGPLAWFDPNVAVTNLTFDDIDFLSPNVDGFYIPGGNVVLTNTTVTDSTFTGNRWAINDGPGSFFDGLTITGNTFTDNLGHVLEFVPSTVHDALIAENDFIDGRGVETTIWIDRVGENNVIRDNTFIQNEAANSDRWAIYVRPVDAVDGEDIGWAIRDNHIDGYEGTQSPITNSVRGKAIIERNTFGPNTAGTTDVESENGQHWFVSNWDLFNNRIQTWRPTAAAFGNDELAVTVAPVDPALPGNNDATSPVDIDVFWTADDNAEVYVGRIEDVSSPETATFPWTGETGFVRVQTIDAEGRSSQYSGTLAAPEDTTPPAPPVVDELPVDGPIEGSGEPGATVTVTDDESNEVCTAVVDGEGDWSCVPAEILPCGTPFAVVQEDLVGNVSEPTEATSEACAEPVAEETPLDGPITGVGEPGATITVSDPDGDVVCETVVGEDGTWSCQPDSDLICGTTYAVVQTIDGVEQGTSEFTTAACAGAGGDGLAEAGASSGLTTLAFLGLTLLLLGVLAVRQSSRRSVPQ